MYNPQQFNFSDNKSLLAHIANFGFGYLITASDGTEDIPVLTPLPMLVSDNIVYGHVSRGNSHWHLFDGTRVAQAVFPGPHGYVSPQWYPDPARSVPTWNYSLVRAIGRPSVVEDTARVDWILAALVAQYEGPEGWSLEQVDGTFKAAQQRGIVAFQMPIDRLEGKAKLSQNKPADVVQTVADKFRQSGQTDLADDMQRHNAGR